MARKRKKANRLSPLLVHRLPVRHGRRNRAGGSTEDDRAISIYDGTGRPQRTTISLAWPGGRNEGDGQSV